VSKESVLYAVTIVIKLVGSALAKLVVSLFLPVQTFIVDYWHYMLLVALILLIVWLCWLFLMVVAVIWERIETLLAPLLFCLWHYGGKLVKGASICAGRCLLAAWLPVPGLTGSGLHRPLMVILFVGFFGIIAAGLILSWRDDPAGLWRIADEIRRYDLEAVFGLVTAVEPLRDCLLIAIDWMIGMVLAGYTIGMAVAGHTALRVFHERRQARSFLEGEGVSASDKPAPYR